jgi:hypothetical protein
MTVAALIEIILRHIRQDFYGDHDREFFRDRLALTKAIARYGFECNSRHWEFSTEAIRADLLKLLNTMRDKKCDIAYLPTYLEGAVDRHIRFRADELNDLGKDGRNIISKTMDGIKPADVREATPVETLGALYKDLKQRRRKRKTAKLPTAKQEELL